MKNIILIFGLITSLSMLRSCNDGRGEIPINDLNKEIMKI